MAYEDDGLWIDILAKYSLRPSAEVETATRTASFMYCPYIPMDMVSSETIKDMVLLALESLDIDNDALAARVARWVHLRFNHLVDRGLGHPTNDGFYVVEVECSFCVDQLPLDTGMYYVGGLIPITGGHFDGDGNGDTDTFDFLTEDEAQLVRGELDKEKIERAMPCSICLIDAPIGSELVRLPCSHRYHVDCIGSWLERRNSCPYCRFELRLT